MNTLFNHRTKGFTIIELLIVLMILAILVAIAYPSYTQYARKAKRGEAQQLLMNWSVNQEIWRSNNPSYDDGTNLPAPENDYYALSVSGTSATTYLLTATAEGGQVKDKAKNGDICSPLTLDQNGVKLPAACWD
jgi:type IV pilus assembly protein PilE